MNVGLSLLRFRVMRATWQTMITSSVALVVVGCGLWHKQTTSGDSLPTVPPLRPKVWVPTSPEGMDRRLLRVEAWRTRVRLSECALVGAKPDTADRVMLAALEFSVTPWGMVDSVVASGQRLSPDQCGCIARTVKSWVFINTDYPRVYRTIIPISLVPARPHILGETELTSCRYREVTRSIAMQVPKWGQVMADCYREGRGPPTDFFDPTRKEIAVVRFTLEPDGVVSGARVVDPTVGHDRMDGCMADVAVSWQFDTTGARDTFEFPLTFGGR